MTFSAGLILGAFMGAFIGALVMAFYLTDFRKHIRKAADDEQRSKKQESTDQTPKTEDRHRVEFIVSGLSVIKTWIVADFEWEQDNYCVLTLLNGDHCYLTLGRDHTLIIEDLESVLLSPVRSEEAIPVSVI